MKPILFSGVYLWPNGICYVADREPNYVRISDKSYEDPTKALSAIESNRDFTTIEGFSLPASDLPLPRPSAAAWVTRLKPKFMSPDVPMIEQVLSFLPIDHSVESNTESNKWLSDMFLKHVVDPLSSFLRFFRDQRTYQLNFVYDFSKRLKVAEASNNLNVLTRLGSRVGNDGVVLLSITA